jgi:DNA-binding GntR family transcriptional regulator
LIFYFCQPIRRSTAILGGEICRRAVRYDQREERTMTRPAVQSRDDGAADQADPQPARPRPARGAIRAPKTRPRRPQLSEEVAAHLRDLIMSGEIRPGEFIRLEEVAEELGVSITPVREALLTLRGEDMVELEPRRGYVVAPLSRQDVNDLFRLQADIAGELAARAAASISPADLADLADLQQGLVAAVEATRVDDIEHLEFEFHRIVNRAAAARKLSWFLHAATRYTPARFYSSDAGWRTAMLSDHKCLLKALGERDADAVRGEMVRHFTDGAERLIDHLDEIGFWTPPSDEH